MSIEFYEVAPASVVGQIKSVRVPQQGRKQIVFKLTDADGRPVNLRKEQENPPVPVADFSPQRQAVGANVEIWLKTSTGPFYGSNIINVQGELAEDVPAQMGFVSFVIDETNTQWTGVYSANIGRFVSGRHLVDTWPAIIIVEPNAFATRNQNAGMLTIPEVRYSLLDYENGTDGAPYNNLLDDVEFTDVEIQYAMQRVIDKWNETPPPVFPQYNGFAYRYWWMKGTCAQLLGMAAHRYRRNRLDYQAGGIAINDQSKAEEYQTMSKELWAEFDTWMMTEKVRINMEACWGGPI